MLVGFRTVSIFFTIALVAAGTACSTKKQVKLEMTRETVITNPAIDSLTLDPTGKIDTRERGYTVEVTMTGDPGLDATFDVEGRFEGRAMREVEPGVYVGSFNVAAGEAGVPWVVGHLGHAPSGARQSLRHGGTLELWVAAPPPTGRRRVHRVHAGGARSCAATAFRLFRDGEVRARRHGASTAA